MIRELLIGCGSDWGKRIFLQSSNYTAEENAISAKTWHNLTTLDFNKDHNPNIIADLEQLPLPIEDNSFEEVHAYEVLEHLGRQGDYKTFFAQFSEFWRILKPNGALCATVPWWQDQWAWADPSHTRIIAPGTLTFLDQSYYEKVGKCMMSDFRFCYQADFFMEEVGKMDVSPDQDDTHHSLIFILRAVKPSRYKDPKCQK